MKLHRPRPAIPPCACGCARTLHRLVADTWGRCLGPCPCPTYRQEK